MFRNFIYDQNNSLNFIRLMKYCFIEIMKVPDYMIFLNFILIYILKLTKCFSYFIVGSLPRYHRYRICWCDRTNCASRPPSSSSPSGSSIPHLCCPPRPNSTPCPNCTSCPNSTSCPNRTRCPHCTSGETRRYC